MNKSPHRLKPRPNISIVLTKHVCRTDSCSISSPVDDFEWIDPPPIDQLGGGRTAEVREHEDGKMSPHTRIRKQWKSAIQQQILLNRMDKENLLFESEVAIWFILVLSPEQFEYWYLFLVTGCFSTSM